MIKAKYKDWQDLSRHLINCIPSYTRSLTIKNTLQLSETPYQQLNEKKYE